MHVIAHGDLHSRIVALTAKLAQEPTNATMYLQRGELHRQHREWDAALQDVARASALDPTLPTLDLVRGLTLFEANQCPTAHQALTAFLSRHPAQAEALVARARTNVCLAEFLAAAADFTSAAALLPRSDYYLERAQALVAAGPAHFEAAVRSIEEGLTALGFIITLHEFALDVELQQGHVEAALRRVDRIIAAMPRPETWLVRRGAILEQVGQLPAARQARPHPKWGS